MDIELSVKGLPEAFARLDEMAALGQQKLLMRILRKASKPVAEAASTNARKFGRSNALAVSVRGVQIKRPPRGASRAEVARVSVAPVYKDSTANYAHNAFYGRKRKGVFYGHLLEFGHRVGTRRTGYLQKLNRPNSQRSGGSGQVAARPWFRPAVSANTAQASSIFLEEVRRAGDRLARRKGQKAANPEGLVT